MSSRKPSPCEFNFDDVMERVTEALRAESVGEVATALGFTSSAFANRKKSGSLPCEQLVGLALRHGWDVRWIFTGQRQPVGELDPELLSDIVVSVGEAFGRYGVSRELKGVGMFGAMIYNDAVRLSDDGQKRREIATASADLIAKTISHKK